MLDAVFSGDYSSLKTATGNTRRTKCREGNRLHPSSAKRNGKQYVDNK